MNIVQAFILSVVEGVTEFLPISSTGHLILFSNILHIPQTEFVKTFEIVIQIGAILAVVPIFIKKLADNPKIIICITLGFIPTALTGLLFYKHIKTILLVNPIITVLSLILGGILFIVLEQKIAKKTKSKTIASITPPEAFIIGIFQSISIIPGVSRAASTILGGMILGLNREEAVSFSFLLAVPTIAAASLYDLIKSQPNLTSQNIGILLLGVLGSFIFAHITVKIFLSFVKRSTFLPFGIYRIVIGIIFFFLIPR